MNINVPPQAQDEFWDEPPEGHWEFWGLRFKPKCEIGDKITFHFNGEAVAEAIVAKVERPGSTECAHTGRFKSLWKVYWRPDSFRDLRG